MMEALGCTAQSDPFSPCWAGVRRSDANDNVVPDRVERLNARMPDVRRYLQDEFAV